MTDKEEKAIEYLYKKSFSDNNPEFNSSIADTILNLISKLQKENEELKLDLETEKNEHLLREMRNRKENELQSKVIEEMENYIWDYAYTDLYCNNKKIEENNCYISGYDKQKCKYCIKQYFINKVKGGKQSMEEEIKVLTIYYKRLNEEDTEITFEKHSNDEISLKIFKIVSDILSLEAEEIEVELEEDEDE